MNEIETAIKKYSEAASSLKQGVATAVNELEKDGVIQRFEFSTELLWKTLKVILTHEGYDCKTPRQCLKQGFKSGLITDSEDFLDLLEDRNRSSHLYNKKMSEELFKKIKREYLALLLSAENKLKAYLKENK